MRILTATNLFPTPEHPARGMFNLNRFAALAGLADLHNCCLVPCWRPWRWPVIRGWQAPVETGFPTVYRPVMYVPRIGRSIAAALYAYSLRQNSWLLTQISKADLIYAPWLYPDGAALVRFGRRWQKPVWLMAQGSDTFHLQDRSRRKQLVKACHGAQGIICVAPHLAQRLTRAGVPHHKLHVVPNGVDTALFRPRSPTVVLDRMRRMAEDAPQDGILPMLLDRKDTLPKLFLFVGNLHPVKGSDLLIEAWLKFLAQLPDFKDQEGPQLVVIGRGPMQAQLARRLHSHVAGRRVHFLGSQTRRQVAQWMNLAHCLCLSSRSEGMPNVVAEALASGLPVIATDVGACAGMLQDEPFGCIVPTEDGVALMHALQWAWKLRPEREAISRRHSAYTWQDQARRTLNLFEGALK